ncbi:NUDIX domain-containing protein [Caldovatus sp. SYSU G05006]|uniref:NUDIX domain-containing protein n=1 Tax=Caldovatus aquaticus TaxID=2865671 RepID=A0ABS7F2U1_9PROT|nr:NUDIX domain-containing protein [Caldovatus aquaticus]
MVVTDGARVLLGRPPQSRLWDIPKGLAAPGETLAQAAARELEEETGLRVPPEALAPLGVHAYRPGKDLALFLWRPPAMPDPATLRCRSTVRLPGGRRIPEIAAFAVVPWEEALARVGRNLARVLTEARQSPAWPFPDPA